MHGGAGRLAACRGRVPHCALRDLGLVGWEPLAGGLLSRRRRCPSTEHCGECNCEAELRRIIELQAELAWTHSVLAYLAGIIVLGCILVLWVLGCGSLCCCCSRLGVGSGNKPKPGIALPDRSPSPVPWSQTRRPGPVRPSDLSDGR